MVEGKEEGNKSRSLDGWSGCQEDLGHSVERGRFIVSISEGLQDV